MMFRNAIALNNFGVQMLKHRCYSQALSTMIDALSLIKISLDETNTKEVPLAEVRLCQLAAVDEKYRNALDRISCPLPDKITDTLIEVLVTDGLDNDFIQSLASDTASNIIVYPVLIEDSDMIHSNPSKELESAIILYNIALAHHCIGQSPNRSQQLRTEHQKNAVRLINLACSVFRKAETEPVIVSCTTAPLKVKAIILSSLVQVMKCSFDLEQSNNNSDLILDFIRSHLRATLQEIEKLNSIFGDYKKANAAAA